MFQDDTFTQSVEINAVVHTSKRGPVMVRSGLRSHIETWGYASSYAIVDEATVNWIKVLPAGLETPSAPVVTSSSHAYESCDGNPDWLGVPTTVGSEQGCFRSTYGWAPAPDATGFLLYSAPMPGNPGCLVDAPDSVRQFMSLPADTTSIALYFQYDRYAAGRVCLYISSTNAAGESERAWLPNLPES
jgi:hypothetical protein